MHLRIWDKNHIAEDEVFIWAGQAAASFCSSGSQSPKSTTGTLAIFELNVGIVRYVLMKTIKKKNVQFHVNIYKITE